MATVSTKPQLVSAAPSIANTGADLIVSVPVTNLGQAVAERVYVTDISLGAVPRTSPKNFPVYVGELAFEALGNVGARFSAASLAVGGRYLLTIRGTHGRAPAVGFTISRYVVIPAAVPDAVVTLRARVGVALAGASWSYTVYNDEPAGAPFEIAAFHLDVVAPLGMISSPPGWIAETDALTYVAWFTGDESVPRIKPGSALAGFAIQSATTRSEATPYSLISWNTQTNQAGPVGLDTVLSPMRP